MNLRKLEERDAPLMLEWMHDPCVVSHLGANFSEKTIEDCLAFIQASHQNLHDLHLAVVNDQDEYMGTVSLKHMDFVTQTAEFAITVRSCAMGQGYSRYAMAAILEHGQKDLGLHAIYWCVNRDNLRAVRFYDKNGYQRTQKIPENITANYTPTQLEGFAWYLYQ